ncbi:amidase family protein [Pseudotabrizicola sp. 4114]|uniref:amidase family protein n=1 Tax=Pseudotabrizicola sp. 4114 TaxID=2817731 RepID=UPI0028557D5E|nr:Asp-tRNA(Asn)/Glu-tRNA(Gln) amidotransferase A subunit family amidase [Pseudorhodobacter sp. 4114]
MTPGQTFDFVSTLGDGMKGKRIAVLKEGFAQDGKDSGFPAADPAVDAKVRAAINAFRQLGAEERDAPILDIVANSLDMLRNTCVADLTGHPSHSLPCGKIDGLPVGLMLTARHMDDMVLLQAARAFETLGDWQSM